MSKKKCQIRHAKHRALERFGLELNDNDYRLLCRKIQLGNSIILEKQSNRVSIHKIEWKEQELTVAYDRLRKTIVSFFPDDSRFQ